MQKKSAFPLFVLILLLTASLNEARAARDEVRDYERLRLLQQATGSGTSSSNSFETRVNALLDTGSNATPAYVSQANEDARIAQAALAVNSQKINTAVKSKTAAPNQNTSQHLDGKIPGYEAQTAESVGQVQGLVDDSEEAYQKRLQEEKEKEEILKRKLQDEEPAQAAKNAEKKAEESGLPPLLSNNPFYMAGAAGSAKAQQDYENNRALTISRLVQQGGYTRSDAQRMVSEAGSPEELIITLMNDGLTYGDASDLVRNK